MRKHDGSGGARLPSGRSRRDKAGARSCGRAGRAQRTGFVAKELRPMMLIQAGFAAWRQVFSPPLRRVLWKSLALTIALLVVAWFALTRLFDHFLTNQLPAADHP